MKKIRMLDWLMIALALGVLIWVLAPQQLGVTAYKLSLISAAAVVGYWLDRGLFPYARPDRIGSALERGAAMLRRAIVVAACVIGVALGA